MDGAWWSSPYTGLFAGYGPIPRRAHDPDVVVCNGELPPWEARSTALAVGGVGLDADSATLACVGEAVERTMAHALPCDRLVWGTAGDWTLDEPRVDPDRWVLFHPEQYREPGFPFEPFTERTECRWVCFRRWPEGDPVWIPEEFGFLFQPAGHPHRIGPSISTGLASGTGTFPVLLRAVQEVVERDAVTLGWWGLYDWERWAEAAIWRLVPDLAPRVRRPNLRWGFHRVVTPYSAHAVVVTLEGEDLEGPTFSVGSACRETRPLAWRKAILEAIHGRHFARYERARVRQGLAAVPRPPRDFGAHAVYYSLYPEELARAPLQRAKEVEADGEGASDEPLVALQDRLGPAQPILWRLMTPPGLAESLPEWRVVRAVVPGLQPLHGDACLPHLGGRWRTRDLAEWRRLPPHPFP